MDKELQQDLWVTGDNLDLNVFVEMDKNFENKGLIFGGISSWNWLDFFIKCQFNDLQLHYANLLTIFSLLNDFGWQVGFEISFGSNIFHDADA